MIGIYKITSPSNKIYIGQSIDIDKRFYKYKLLDCILQIRLYRSFNKYGIENHIFEVLEECDENQLNNKERYYQDLYDVIGKNGLNCKLTETEDKSGRLSEETKKKISESNKGKKLSKIHINKLKNKIISKEQREKLKIINLGKKHPKETRLKISKSNLGKKHTEESKIKMSLSSKGIKKTKEHCIKIGLCKKGKKLSEEHKFKISINSKQSKKVINTITGEIYNSIAEASLKLNIKNRTLSYQLNEAKINKTNLIFLNNEK